MHTQNREASLNVPAAPHCHAVAMTIMVDPTMMESVCYMLARTPGVFVAVVDEPPTEGRAQ